MSRELTIEETRNALLDYIWDAIEFWSQDDLDKNPRERLQGVCHTVLAALDGCADGLPGFLIAPCPHPTDRQFHIENDDDWFPENNSPRLNAELGGGLHKYFYERKPRLLDSKRPMMRHSKVAK